MLSLSKKRKKNQSADKRGAGKWQLSQCTVALAAFWKCVFWDTLHKCSGLRIFKDFHLRRARACSDARLLEEPVRVGGYSARPMTHQDNLAPVIFSIFTDIKNIKEITIIIKINTNNLAKRAIHPINPATVMKRRHLHTFLQRLYWWLLFLPRGHFVIFQTAPQNIFKQHLNICQDRAILRSIQEHLIRATK